MLFLNSFTDTLVMLFIYMFIYNLSLIIIFWTLHQFISFNFKTLFSFADLKFNFYFVTSITITLFSIAGVPPFLGFFSKLLILLILINSNFFFFYCFLVFIFIYKILDFCIQLDLLKSLILFFQILEYLLYFSILHFLYCFFCFLDLFFLTIFLYFFIG